MARLNRLQPELNYVLSWQNKSLIPQDFSAKELNLSSLPISTSDFFSDISG